MTSNKEEGRGDTVHIATYGCQMNRRDSEIISSMLVGAGYRIVDSAEEARVIVFNTCCVRENAEERVYGRLGQLKSFKELRPGTILAVGGCMAQKDGAAVLKRAPWTDLVFGVHALYALPDLLEKVRAGQGPLVSVPEHPRPMVSQSGFCRREPGVRAWISVMEGCNNFCAYCVVPHVRGPERSKPPELVIEEVRSAVADGYKEVFLLGQNVNSYGADLAPRTGFPKLLELVNEVDGVGRIRFTTSHPKDFSPELVDTIASLDHVCEHVHLPLQAGADRVLESMNRGYTLDEYVSRIEMLRSKVPGVGLTTDIIAGFPGETESDFQRTVCALETIRYDGAYIFKYSTRPGTAASRLDRAVPHETVVRRHAELLELQKTISKEKIGAAVGKEDEVLVEEVSRRDSGLVKGHTRDYRVAVLEGDDSLIGKAIPVRIVGVDKFTLQAEPLQCSAVLTAGS